MLARISLTARVGLALVLIPLASLGGWAAWYFTRVWLPLNIPISLARGHVRAEFDINVESRYAMQIELNAGRTRLSDAMNLAAVAWSVSKEECILTRGTGGLRTRSIGGSDLFGAFQGGKGHYVVDLDVLEDQSRLNVYKPWLLIYEDGGKYFSTTDLGALFLLALLLGGPVGASMTILGAVHWRQEKLAAWWRAYPMTQPGLAPGRFPPTGGRATVTSRRPKSATPRPFARLSQTSLVLVLTLFNRLDRGRCSGLGGGPARTPTRLTNPCREARIHHTSKPGDSARSSHGRISALS